jgi:hypothetical protein
MIALIRRHVYAIQAILVLRTGGPTLRFLGCPPRGGILLPWIGRCQN